MNVESLGKGVDVASLLECEDHVGLRTSLALLFISTRARKTLVLWPRLEARHVQTVLFPHLVDLGNVVVRVGTAAIDNQ